MDVERWAELRREHFVRGVSIKELMRRTGLARNSRQRGVLAAAISTICALITCQYGNVYERASDSNTARSSSDSSIRYGLCLGISVPSREDRMPDTLRPMPDANT